TLSLALVTALLAEPTRVYYVNQLSDDWVKKPDKAESCFNQTRSRFLTPLFDILSISPVSSSSTNLKDPGIQLYVSVIRNL
ncbi:hypothetical protein BGX38DRAFT_1236977, partial [Terfezia claveryi]